MAKSTKAEKAEAKQAETEDCERGKRLRDVALDCYIRDNPTHGKPEWRELRDWSVSAWTKLARALVAAGWRAPS